MMNIQFIVYNETVYIIEVNPRSSRTVPYISKVTGIPAIALATRAMLGERLADMAMALGFIATAAITRSKCRCSPLRKFSERIRA